MKSVILAQAAALLATWGLAMPSPLPIRQERTQKQEPATIKVDTDLVLLNAVVMDQKGQTVLGLGKAQFKIFEDDNEQRIDFFSLESVPVSWGLVLDRSGSMSGMIENVYRAATHVVDEGTAKDEAFIITFSETSELVSDFVSDKKKLRDAVNDLRAGGGTALWDSVVFALDHLKRGEHRKKVLVVVTDGEDNHSRFKFEDLVRRVEEEEVLIYTVGMFESGGLFGMLGGNRSVRKQLAQLAEATGAQAHFPSNIKQCREAMDEIARDVSEQYQLGYYPTSRIRDGKWRKIKVVVLRSGNPETKYVVRTRTGYYAPTS